MTATEPGCPAPAAAPYDTKPRATLRLSLADLVTLGNAVFGFLAICWLTLAVIEQAAATGTAQPPSRRDLAAAVVLLLLAATCDLFDGLVARRFGGSRLGAELDNLADVISFGLAPAFFVVSWGYLGGGAEADLALPVAAAVLAAVMVRLARFSCQPAGCTRFTGLPSPLGAMTVVTIVLLDPPTIPALVAVATVAWLMVSRVEYPKPRGNLAVAVLAWIVTSVGCITAWALHLPAGEWLLWSGAALVIALTATVPVYVLVTHRGDETSDVEAPEPGPAAAP